MVSVSKIVQAQTANFTHYTINIKATTVSTRKKKTELDTKDPTTTNMFWSTSQITETKDTGQTAISHQTLPVMNMLYFRQYCVDCHDVFKLTHEVLIILCSFPDTISSNSG